jgi:hypothetical protein
MNRTIFLSDIEPAPLSIRHPLGINLDLLLTMKGQNGAPVDPTPLYPQFVLLPRSNGGTYPYDMTVTDAANGISRAQVPGTALTDRSGYNIELYLRAANEVPGDPPLPVSLAATGVLVTQGAAYTSQGPLGLINIPVVTGPQGPIGETGTRGSVWTTGSGAPTATGNELAGDMYLDEANGDVWRYDGAVWQLGSF